jgi:hypothetical protein
LTTLAEGFVAFGVFTCARRVLASPVAALLPDAARLAGVFLAVAIMPPAWRVD